MGIDTDISELEDFASTLKQSVETSFNLSGLSKQEIVAPVQLAIKSQLDTEGAAGGTKFDQLKPGTLRQKIRLGYPAKILERTGAMRADLLSDGGVSVDVSEGGFRLDVSFTNKVASYHQTGTRRGLPQRQILVLTDQLGDDLAKISFAKMVENCKNRLAKR